MTQQLFAIVESLKNAEKNGHKKAYLARLAPGPHGTVERNFAPKLKELNKNNRRCFRMKAEAGDVFEARRWNWDGNRGEYVGGTVWFGVQGDGSLFPLTREEAVESVHLPRIATDGLANAITVQRPSRIAPSDVYVRMIDLDPAPQLEGPNDDN